MRCRRGRDPLIVIYIYLRNQCLSPLKIVSSIPVNSEVYWLQHHVMKCFSHFRQVDGFLPIQRFHSPIKLTDTI